MSDLKPVPFIVGSVRSGTTMFCLMLHAHPELAMGFESFFVPKMIRMRDRWERPDGFDLDRYVDDLYGHWRGSSFRAHMGIPQEVLREQLHGVAPIDYAEAVRRVFRLYASRDGKPRYGDKAAGYVPLLPELAELFPETRFLHIVRDGRDAACAHRDASWGPGNLVDAGRDWVRQVTTLRDLGRSVGPGRYLEVRYEELVDEPERVLRSVCAFVDLDFDPHMCEYHVDGMSALSGVRFENTAHRSTDLPPTRGLRDWRRDLDRPELERLEAKIGDTLVAFGYDRETHPSLRARFDSRVSDGTHLARRVRRHLRRHRRKRT